MTEHQNRIPALLPVLLLLLLAGCSSKPAVPPASTDGQPLPIRQQITALPFFPQPDYQCGPAALATLLVFQGMDITPEQLIDEVYLPARQGSLQIELLATARQHGLIPYPLQTHEQLLQEVAAGHPVLVFQNLGLSRQPVWHFAVISGYDLQQEVFYLHSGTRQHHATRFTTFQHTWQRAGSWAWLLLPPDQLPATTDLRTSLNAIHQLELSQQPDLAATAYQATLMRWPQEPLPRLLLANIEFDQGRPASAAEQLTQALTLQPDLVAAWHNLGQVLKTQTGCRTEAYKALYCAARLQGQAEAMDHGRVVPDSKPCPLATPPTCPIGD